MTKETFNIVKLILNIWLVLMFIGSVMLMSEDFGLYLIQLIIVGLNFWFINQLSIKEKPESKIDIEVK